MSSDIFCCYSTEGAEVSTAAKYPTIHRQPSTTKN